MASGASGGNSSRGSGFSTSGSTDGAGFPPSASAALASAEEEDMEFGAFSMAERTSDPYADVYGAEPDFAAPSTSDHGTKTAGGTADATMDSQLLSFSPLGALGGEADPFADITGGVGASSGADGSVETATVTIPPATATTTTSASASSSRSAPADILDLVWGTSSNQEAPAASMTTPSPPPSSTSSSTAGGNGSKNSSGFYTLPPPPSSASSSFSTGNGNVSTGELLSFSPLKPAAEAPSNDPFFGLSGSTSAINTSVFDNDDLFSLSATTPQSASSSSAPASLHGSFASLHEATAPPSGSPEAASTKMSSEQTSPRFDPFAERTTRSFGSLSSSFAAVGSLGGVAEQGTGAINTLVPNSSTDVTATTALSSSSAPASLHGSFELGAGMMGFATSEAHDSDVVDPFEEAGLSFEQVPLEQALAAWDSGASAVVESEQDAANDDVQTGDNHEEGVEDEQRSQAQDEAASDHEVFNTLKDEEQIGNAQDSVTERKETVVSSDEVEADSSQVDSELLEPSLVAETRMLDPFSSVSSPVGSSSAKLVTDEPSTVGYAPFGFPSQEANGELQADAFSGESESEQVCDIVHPVSGDNAVDWPEEKTVVGGFGEPLEGSNEGFMVLSSPAVADTNESNAEGVQSSGLDSDDHTSSETHSVDHEAGTNSEPEATKMVAAATSEDESGEAVEKQQKTKEGWRGAGFGGDGNLSEDAVDEDGFGDFGGFAAAPVAATSADQVPSASDDFGSFPPLVSPQQPAAFGDGVDTFGDFNSFAGASTAAETAGSAAAAFENDAFGDFSGAHGNAENDEDDDDGFGGFVQSTNVGGDDADFGDFGDFEQSSAQDGAADAAFNDDGFGDFTPSAIVTPVVPAAPSMSSAASKEELSTFFQQAFPITPLPSRTPVSPPTIPESYDTNATDATAPAPTKEFVQHVFCSTLDEYISLVTTTGRGSSSSSASLSSSPVAREGSISNGPGRMLQSKKVARASKYLKYVLSEKIQEASRQNGIFPHGSDRHQTYVQLAASGDPVRMRAGLKELQDALFLNSVNDAMMRIAKQAALSAKAKIAEQAAQQQASSRGGSLFATTRHLLSRSGGNTMSGSHSSGGSGSDGKGDHTGADTPTGASVQKLSRFSFSSTSDDSTNATSGESSRSEDSSRTAQSGGSESDVTIGVATSDSRTRSTSQAASGNGGSNSGSSGGIMKTFQARFSPFSSSRHRPRFVSLRRKGQSGEDVRQMELNLDAISGGLDEAKWKCAVFLYDVEEVAHVAPSQIRILAYPSKQPLTGKTDRSALVKLLKPGTIWTVDIGANNSDMLNEW